MQAVNDGYGALHEFGSTAAGSAVITEGDKNAPLIRHQINQTMLQPASERDAKSPPGVHFEWNSSEYSYSKRNESADHHRNAKRWQNLHATPLATFRKDGGNHDSRYHTDEEDGVSIHATKSFLVRN
jgi:hypothetical protein